MVFTNLVNKFIILIHLLYFSTCFEQCYAHLQEDKLYYYSIWYCHCLWVTVQCTGYERTVVIHLLHSSTCFEQYCVLIFRRAIVLVQHMVLSLSLGDCSVHRLREDYRNTFITLLYMFRAILCSHLQKDNCISTASGIITVFG